LGFQGLKNVKQKLNQIQKQIVIEDELRELKDQFTKLIIKQILLS